MCESSGCRGAGRQAWSAMQRGADAAKRGDVEELLENLAHSHVKVAKMRTPTPAAVMSSTGMRMRAGTQVWPGHGSSGGMLDRLAAACQA